MTEQVIIRRKVTTNFTVLDNALILDKRLSWKALGLLTFLLSLPPDFKLRLNHLSKQRSTGRDATRSGLKELEDTGYLLISIERHLDGKFACTTWTVSDRPYCETKTHATQPRSENPKPAEQEADNPTTAKPPPRKPTLTSTTNKKELTLQKTTTTREAGEKSSLLIFPSVGVKELTSLEKIIATVPAEIQQDFLDEIEGKRQKGTLRSGAIALARYLSQNIDSFLLMDGHYIQTQRQYKSTQMAEEARQKNEDAMKDAEISKSLVQMTDEEFEAKHRGLPENIRNRVEMLRQNEISRSAIPQHN